MANENTNTSARSFRHGGTRLPEYFAWRGMKDRCLNRNSSSFHHYGGSGITVSSLWLNDFPRFLADVGSKPSPEYSLDLFPDSNGNYEPGNVRWARKKECCKRRINVTTGWIHGLARTPIYKIWRGIKSRCFNPQCKQYSCYGGRGISMCPEWAADAKLFADYMGSRPSGYSIERVDNDKGYEPGNCIWADRLTQARNRRTNVSLTINGDTKLIGDWAKHAGMWPATIAFRLKCGEPIDENLLRKGKRGGPSLIKRSMTCAICTAVFETGSYKAVTCGSKDCALARDRELRRKRQHAARYLAAVEGVTK